MSYKVPSTTRSAFVILRDEGIKIFLKTTISYIRSKLERYMVPYAKMRIKNSKNLNLYDSVDFCFRDMGGLLKPAQVRDEILGLLEILNEIKPKNIIEIGTAKGGTLFLLSRVSDEDATIISVDLLHGTFGGGYPKWKIPLYEAFRLPNQEIHLIRADSHTQKTLKNVKNILDYNKVDFLFIDGDHTYEGVKRDFEMYSPLVKDGGIIAFHDIAVHPPETGCEVSKFWSEIKQKYEYIEIIRDLDQGWAGIGILYVKFNKVT